MKVLRIEGFVSWLLLPDFIVVGKIVNISPAALSTFSLCSVVLVFPLQLIVPNVSTVMQAVTGTSAATTATATLLLLYSVLLLLEFPLHPCTRRIKL